MAYNKKKIYEQAIPKLGIIDSLQYFTKENQFSNKKNNE